ncbi:hypothetical protein SEA_MIEK_33 [Streptomyces phage Miek]|nr:hypothetical protein SEA_SENDITCS_32 [Streptomyces phage SendItCS]WIC89370.1 hypothetical protein SEA_MIEK_33 [Streptomyces phage Miek]
MLGNKKRSLRLSLEKDKKTGTPGDDNFLRPETVKAIADQTKKVAKYVAITAVAAYAAIKAIDTVSEIAVKKTKSADNKED